MITNNDRDLDTHLRKVCKELNQVLSERYIKANDDIGYIKKMWDFLSVVHEGVGYNNMIAPWSSVEETITDCYIDLVVLSRSENQFDKRKDSLMLLYDTVMRYMSEKFNDKKTTDLKEYLTSYIPQLNSSK
ncbi:MAG: hypothetical protein ACP5OA_01840 [Candidatus Woesearchaeota archaeon]